MTVGGQVKSHGIERGVCYDTRSGLDKPISLANATKNHFPSWTERERGGERRGGRAGGRAGGAPRQGRRQIPSEDLERITRIPAWPTRVLLLSATHPSHQLLLLSSRSIRQEGNRIDQRLMLRSPYLHFSSLPCLKIERQSLSFTKIIASSQPSDHFHHSSLDDNSDHLGSMKATWGEHGHLIPGHSIE